MAFPKSTILHNKANSSNKAHFFHSTKNEKRQRQEIVSCCHYLNKTAQIKVIFDNIYPFCIWMQNERDFRLAVLSFLSSIFHSLYLLTFCWGKFYLGSDIVWNRSDMVSVPERWHWLNNGIILSGVAFHAHQTMMRMKWGRKGRLAREEAGRSWKETKFWIDYMPQKYLLEKWYQRPTSVSTRNLCILTNRQIQLYSICVWNETL